METKQYTYTDGEQLLKIGDIAKRLTVSRSTIERWRRTEGFPEPFTTVGKSPRWLAGQLTDWLREFSERSRQRAQEKSEQHARKDQREDGT